MSTGYSLHFYILWITLQILVFGYSDPCLVMAEYQFTPYVSEFEYTSRFHPSKNPHCSTGWSENSNGREAKNNRQNFESTRFERSPEEGPPVGQEPSIEVRAILIRCPKTDEVMDDVLINRNIYNITAGRSHDILDFHGFDRDEPARHSEIRDCRRKLLITMKFNNIGKTKTQEEFVVIDHVLDPVTLHKARLLNPLVVKVRQEPVLQLYGLKFQGIVNAEAREEVINNKIPNFTGCNDSSENPTCGQMFLEDKPIPYSQGFCCSCDPDVNFQRQAASLNDSRFSNIPSRNKEKFTKLFKSARSVKTNFFDELSGADGISNLSSANMLNEHGNSIQQDKINLESNSVKTTHAEDLEKNERDLRNLKDMKKRSEKTRRFYSNLKTDDIEKENGIESDDSSRWTTLSPTSNYSESIINEKPSSAIFDGRDIEIQDENGTNESEVKTEKKLSKHELAIDIINELAKLEKDYEKFRMSSEMREIKKSNDTSNTGMNFGTKNTLDNEKYSDKTMSSNDEEKFRSNESFETQLVSKNVIDNQYLIWTLTTKKSMPFDETIFAINSTFSSNPKFSSDLQDKDKINSENSLFPSSDVRPANNLQAVTTTPPTFLTTSAGAILWQKLVSDRVYPSNDMDEIFTKLNEKIIQNEFRSRKMTTEMSSAIVSSSDTSLASADDFDSSNNGSIFEYVQNDVEITTTSKSNPTMIQFIRSHPTTSFNRLSNRVEKFSVPSSSFSNGNYTQNDTISVSDSLRKQIGNLLTSEERKKFDTRDGSENPMENYDGKSEFGNKVDVATTLKDDAKNPTSFHNVPIKTSDRSNKLMAHRRLGKVSFQPGCEQDLSKVIDDEIILPGSGSSNEENLRDTSMDNSNPIETDIISRENLKRRDIPRAYRSIAKDDRFPNNNDNRQKIIDERIEDEFNKISAVLRDVGGTTREDEVSKIVREKPKADETFEKDDSIIDKFTSILNEIPKDVTYKNNSTTEQNFFETQIPTSQNDSLMGGINQVKNENGRPKIERDSNGNVPIKTDDEEIDKADTVVDHLRVTEGIQVKDDFPTTDQENPVEIVKHTKQFIEPISEIPQTTGHRIIVDRFKIINEYKDIPKVHKKCIGFTNVSSRNYGKRPEWSHESISEIPQPRISRLNADESKITKNSENSLHSKRQQLEERALNSQRLTHKFLLNKKEIPLNVSIPKVASPVFTIENLKKQLRNEAKRYSSLREFQSLASRPESKNVERYSKSANKNVGLIKNEKDLMLNEETILSDEQSNLTTYSVPKTTYFNSFVTTASFVDPVTLKSKISSRLSIRRSVSNFPNNKLPTSVKKWNEGFLLVEPHSSSPPESLRILKNGRHYENNNRFHHYRKHDYSRNKKRLTRNRRKIDEKKIETKVDENLSNKDTPTFLHTAQKKYIKSAESELKNKSNQSLIQEFIDSNETAEGASAKKAMKAEGTTKRLRRDPKTFHRQTFPSFYPKSSDIIAMSEHERSVENDKSNRNDKRDKLIASNENMREAEIFYDYEDRDSKSIDDNANVDGKRSLNNILPEEIIDGIKPSEGWKEKMELLKLKKHADVLKEYLNWRHDVAPPINHEIPDYTTKINIIKKWPVETTASVIATSSKKYSSTTLPISELTQPEITESFSTRHYENTDGRMKNSDCRTSVTEKTSIIPTVESPTITAETNTLGNCDKSETKNGVTSSRSFNPIDNDDNIAKDYFDHSEETATGRILPPCDSPTKLFHHTDDQPTNKSSVPRVTSTNGTVPMTKNNGLVIISIFGNKLLGNNVERKKENNEDSLKKMENTKVKVGSVSGTRHRRHTFRNKNSMPKSHKREKLMPGRRLMSIQLSSENDDEYKEHSGFHSGEKNNYARSSHYVKTNHFDRNNDSVALKKKWNDIIDKIIHENSSEASSDKNRTGLAFKEIPNDNRSVLKKLHFYNADKYIKKIAKQIVKNGNIHYSKDEKDLMTDKIKGRRRTSSSVGRKLKQHPDQSATTIKKVDSDDLTNSQLNVVHEKRIFKIRSDSSRSKRRKKNQNDIFLQSGKIPVDDSTDSQPTNTSLDRLEKIGKINETLNSPSDETTKHVNETMIYDKGKFPTNVLPNVVRKVDVSVNQKRNVDKPNNNSNVYIHRSVRSIRDNKVRAPKGKRRAKVSDFLKNILPVIRKATVIDSQASKRYSKNRDDRSYDLSDFQDLERNEDSQEYPEYSSADEYNSEYEENDDFPGFSKEVRNRGSRQRDFKDAPQNILANRDVKLIESSTSSLSPGYENQPAENMTKMPSPRLITELDEEIPRRTEIIEKIKAAPLSWVESNTPDTEKPKWSPNPSESHPSYAPESVRQQEPEGIQQLDQRIVTDNPMNLKVIRISSVDQPTMENRTDAIEDSRLNYGLAPLMRVNVQQQSNKETPACNLSNLIIPDENFSAIKTTHPTNVINDNPRFEQHSTFSNDASGKLITTKPSIATMIIDLEEDSSEPSCSTDKQIAVTQSPEHSASCENNGFASSPDTSVSNLSSQKQTRMKNMLAIVEFMKKIHKIMSNDDNSDFSNNDFNDAVIKLERVIILPKSRLDNNSKGIGKTVPNNVVAIGDGVTPDSSCNETSSEENLNLYELEDVGNTANYPDHGYEFKDDESPNRNFTVATNNPDRTFLFYGENPKFPDSENKLNTSLREHKNGKSDENLGLQEQNSCSCNTATQDRTKHPCLNFQGSLASKMVNVALDSEKMDDGKNSWKIDFLRRLRLTAANDQRDASNEKPENSQALNIQRNQKDISREFPSKRKAIDNYPSISKIQHHRSRKRVPLYGKNYRNQRHASGEIYRRKSNDIVNTLEDTMHGGVGAVEGIRREKRKRKKKKRRRKKKKKRKPKKKNKKKKTGRRDSEAKYSVEGWWPFRRQLMSLDDKHHSVLNTKFNQKRDERIKRKKRASHSNSVFVKRRRARRVRNDNDLMRKKRKAKRHYKHKNKIKKMNGKKKKKIMTNKDETRKRYKRQIKPGGTQARGGQDCLDRRRPSNVNPVKFLESAHCLRFSDLWYSAYQLENPIMEHTIYLQLFEKHSLPDGKAHWDDLTQGTMVRMGTFTRHQRDEKPTIVFTYTGAKMESQRRALNLDPATQRLLVPSPVAPNKAAQYPAVRGPGEFLVVPTSSISNDGQECDKAGVGFAAFAKQADRCGREKGTCLKNQPLAYWRHDMEARNSERPGCYFLSNYASVPTNPIKFNITGTGNQEYLGLEYLSAHVSTINIEIRTDYNAIVRVGSSGRVTAVYVDSTSLEHTVVTVVISNMGLASSPYQPRITDCPTGLPVSWTKANGIMQVIPPQHDQRVTLDLYGQLLLNGFHCSVELVNHRGELVAMRRIRIQKMDRCFCVWHCLCACIGSVSGMGCQPMSPEHYHAAGFQGPVPVITTQSSIFMNTVKDVLLLSAMLILLLLLLGLLKWFVGMFAPTVGRWGLNTLLEGSTIDRYFESELRCRCVRTDENGIPVHPDTGQQTVRLCSRKLEFFLNLIFFLTYPIAICCGYFRKSLQSARERRCCPDESKMCLINEKSSCAKMICVSTYGDSRNSRLEAEDTRYVMNELKKSQESLQNPKGTKKNAIRKNEETLWRKSAQKIHQTASDMTAKKFVDDLLKNRTVFRNLTEPIGGLAIPSGTPYSLRGYFLNAQNGGYRFITPCPFKQYWLIEDNQKSPSDPPAAYPSNLFMASYVSARDVYERNEISLHPEGTCINVQHHHDN